MTKDFPATLLPEGPDRAFVQDVVYTVIRRLRPLRRVLGSLVKTFEITPYPITDAMVSNITTQAYTGSPVTPTPVVKKGATTLTLNTDYTLSYEDNVKAGTGAKCIVTGKGNYGGVVVKTFTIQE